MREGCFFVSVRQSSVPSWVPFRFLGGDASFAQRFDQLALRAERSCARDTDAGVAATPLSWSLDGAFALALQSTQEAAGGVSVRRQPVVVATKRAAIVFSGALSNLDELAEGLLHGAGPEPGSSYEAEHGRGAFLPLRGAGDQALQSAEVLLHMYLRSASDAANLPILLSEIQGQYSFVVYNESRRQVFAARDPSGREPLFVRQEDDGSLGLTNAPAPAWGHADAPWQEVQPGHYLGGRNPRQPQQFALTPQQLHLRERAESLEELSPLQARSLRLGGAGPKEAQEERDPSSARSSTSQDRHLQDPMDALFRISV